MTRRLLDAGVAEFASKGFEAARIADIVRRCGLSTGGVYTRWRDKGEFFLAAVRYALAQRVDNIDSLDSFGTNHLRSADSDLDALVIEACVVARRDESMRADIAQVLGLQSSTLTRLVAEAKDAGTVDNDLRTELLVLCCQALSIGSILALATTAEPMPRDIRGEWVDLMNRVVSSWAPPSDA